MDKPYPVPPDVVVFPAHFSLTGAVRESVGRIRRVVPHDIVSTHLPPAAGKLEKFPEPLESLPPCMLSIAPGHAVPERIFDGGMG